MTGQLKMKILNIIVSLFLIILAVGIFLYGYAHTGMRQEGRSFLVMFTDSGYVGCTIVSLVLITLSIALMFFNQKTISEND